MRKIISSLLILSIIVSLCQIAVSATSTDATLSSIPTTGDVWDGTMLQPSVLIQKDGKYYYEITKCSELAFVAQKGENWLNANYILGNNLIFNNLIIEQDEDGNLVTLTKDLKECIPLGTFSGAFYGNGYVISGIYIEGGSNIGLFSEIDDEGNVDGVTLVNGYISGTNRVGGIVGYNNGGEITNCTNYSYVTSTSGTTGGICGASRYTDYYDNEIKNCINYGKVNSKGDAVGGIVGKSSRDDISNCLNYGDICSNGSYTGGIVGFADTYPTILENVNYGTVRGVGYVGGICGCVNGETYLVQCVSNCYNVGDIYGTDIVGGIIGNSLSCKLKNCYNIADINGTTNVGAIIGYTDSIFGKSEEYYNYYLDGTAASGCGNAFDIDGAIEKKDVSQLKTESSYYGWDFDAIWSIYADANDGYPYLQWQNKNSLTSIPVSAISLNQTALKLLPGKYIYISANLTPANATNKTILWSSSNESVAKVDVNGKVTGVSSGTATITASSIDGNVSDSCEVTIEADAWQEYQINSITIKDISGNELKDIPDGNFLATISITNISSGSDTMVVLAKYRDKGAFEGLMYVSAEDMPIGSTIKLTLPIDNKNGDIAKLKAFSWASWGSLTPLGNTVTFPAEQ